MANSEKDHVVKTNWKRIKILEYYVGYEKGGCYQIVLRKFQLTRNFEGESTKRKQKLWIDRQNPVRSLFVTFIKMFAR